MCLIPVALMCFSCCVQGKYKFRCPAVVEGTKQCNKLWTYREVRRLADLSAEEMQYFEETMARLAAADYCDFQPVSRLLVLHRAEC